MAVRTRINPIDRDIALMLSDISPAGRSAALASFAKSQLVNAHAINRQVLGEIPSHQTIVDGRVGSREEAVRADGVIVYDFALLDELFGYIDLQLIKHSPVLTGEYRRSHLLLADGVEIDPSNPMPSAKEYVYLNSLPFARKIERGLSKQAPDGVYQVVATLAARRFGNLARIRFTYRTLFGSKKDKNTRQPAIVVTV